MTLEQEIIELIRLSVTEDVRDIGFSFSYISIGTRSLIRIKCVSKSANCSLRFSLRQGLDHKQVEDVGLLAVVVLVIGLMGIFSQLESLSVGTILGPGTGKTIWLG